MGRSSLARWHVERRCSPEFFADLQNTGGIILTEHQRANFVRSLLDMIVATDLLEYGGAELADLHKQLSARLKYEGVPNFLIKTFADAGGTPRGSWESDGRRLGGPFYRFVRKAFDGVPPRLRPRSPDRLCRLCQKLLRARSKPLKPPPSIGISPDI